MLGSRSWQCSSHEDAICIVDPLSSEDVAVVVDFHWFTDCHLRRSLTWTRYEFSYDLRPPSTGKMFVWSPAFLSEPGSARYSSTPSLTTVWSNYQTLFNDFFEVCITKTVTLSPNVQTVLWPVQLSRCKSCDQSFFVLIGQ